MDNFTKCIEYVLENEGGLADNPNDPGGITNWGISLRTYKELEFPQATADDIKHISRESAIEFYKSHYWLAQYENIFSDLVRCYIFDMAINCGPAIAHKIAQRAVWATSASTAEVIEDGILGEVSLHCINCCGQMIMPALRAERANHYKILILQNSNLKVFESGWLARTYK